MSSSRKFAGAAGLVVMSCMAAAAAAGAGTPENAVLSAEHQWLQALQTNNADLITPLLSDKIVVTTEESKVLAGKGAVLADAKATTWATAKYEDLKVTVFDRTAIATGTFIGKGADSSGKTFSSKLRFTDTWVRMQSGRWLCVAGHDSPSGNEDGGARPTSERNCPTTKCHERGGRCSIAQADIAGVFGPATALVFVELTDAGEIECCISCERQIRVYAHRAGRIVDVAEAHGQFGGYRDAVEP